VCGVDRRRNVDATVDIGTWRPSACPKTTGFECVSAASQLTQGKLLVAHLDKVHESLHSAVNVLSLILDHFLVFLSTPSKCQVRTWVLYAQSGDWAV
jgi:hypothetical protein